MLTLILLLVVAFSQLFISLGIYLESRNKKQVAPKLFVVLSFFTLLWTIANAILLYVDTAGSADTKTLFEVANKAGFTLGASSLLLIYIFCLFYPARKAKNVFQKIIIGAGLALILLSPFEITSGRFALVGEELTYEGGTLASLFAIFALAVLIAIYKESTDALRHLRDKLLKKQNRTLLLGLTLTIVHAIVFIILIPATYSDSAAVYAIGYLAPYYFMGATVYSLLRQNLFDVRLIVARSVAYFLLLGTISVVFAGLVITIPANLIGTGRPSFGRQIYYTFAAIALAFGFQPMRKFFDRITNRLFYQDAYDPQVFLDELNGVIVSNIELDSLLKQCVEIIERNLKVEFCLFGIKETTYSERRLIGNDHKKFSEEDIRAVRAATPAIHQRIIVTDELEEGHEHLRKVLAKNNIALIGRLTTDTVHAIEGTGYLVLGPKKSGNLFNRQDIRVLEIVTKELVVAIQNALRFEEIQNFNIKLQEEVKRQTRHLEDANERLRQLDQTKDDFISMASHQLRTPLTSVKGYLSMVLEGDAGKLSKNQAKLLDQAFISSQRMVFLISDLLNLSRLKTGKFVIEATPINLSEIIEGEVEQLIETAAARGLKLKFEKPDSFPTLMLDETKIRQVIMNFVDNAIYYTPSGGNITVALKETAQSVEFTVKDDGIGVPKSEQHHLFTKFYRAGNAKKARPDGTGLGLFMAKKVIIAQGGSIIFSSQEGKGSTFGFTFAKAKLKPPTITPKPEEAATH